MKRQDEIRESYIRVFIPVCASIFFIFESDVHCVYTAYEYGHKTFQKQLFPNISNASSSEESLCETNTSSQAYKDEQVVQQVVARWGVYINLAQGVPLVFSSLLFSSLSDSMGRKPLLFIVAIGFFTKQLLMTLAMVMEWNIYLFPFYTLIEGASGSWITENAIAYAVVADITNAGKHRSFLMTLLSLVSGTGFSVGTFVSGYIVTEIGYEYSMAMSCGSAGLAIMTICFIPETVSKTQRRKSNFSSIGNLKDMIQFYTKDDPSSPNSTRFRYLTAILSFYFAMGAKFGAFAFEVFYLLGPPFCFRPKEISIFETVKTSLSKLVVILGMRPMQRCLMDELIALIGILSCTAMFVLFGVAQTETFLYIAVPVGCFVSCIPAILRAIMSKMTPQDKQGVLFGSIAVAENICNLSSSVIGGAIYSETVALYRGTAYFVLTGYLVLSAFLLLAFIKNDKKNHNRKDYIAVE
ncbi:proton-coupled folate transporter-like [Crassostrea angulata]|uniref:proton-coupled folate transporter-like n=1 Tax=Magallana angulata TaxID=2784310 RepID=UPI0022B108C7|nr:proton-coupled folate transporter-like [Crassostrea angulata]